MIDHLQSVTIAFSQDHTAFNRELAALLAPLGTRVGQAFRLHAADPGDLPAVCLDFQADLPDIQVVCAFANDEALVIPVENITGEHKSSPHAYRPIPIHVVQRRLADAEMGFVNCDHAGFNLPWFASAVHPRILKLRAELASRCLYHTFPSGEPWDFILPGTEAEIARHEKVDYTKIRKPKFEIVSFDKCSTPLIQIDVTVNGRFEDFAALFPEGLADPQYKNVWLYLDNLYSIDVCLVINQFAEGDWSDFFAGQRL